MDFTNAMRKRYTTKKYNAAGQISTADITALQEILQLSPSSINSQPWKFTFVRDTSVKEKLSQYSWHNTSKVLDCDTVVIFSRIDNLNLFEEQITRSLPEGAVSYYNQFLKPQPEANIKAWFGHQTYLALGIFLSGCAAMGIDATPMEGIEPDHYDKIIGLKDYRSMAAVAIGYRDPEDFNQPSKKPKSRRPINEVITTI